jgi:nitroreductase
MTDLAALIRRRRMTRRFTGGPLAPEVLVELLDIARRAPSAGYSQGVHFLALEGDVLARFWDETVEPHARDEIASGIGKAAALVIPLADAEAYTSRYSEPDKAQHGLSDAAAWPVPYWLTDTAMATQNLLLLAEERGIGALLFGLFRDAGPFLASLGVPGRMQPLGGVALGPRAADDVLIGSAATRARLPVDAVVHVNGWVEGRRDDFGAEPSAR